MTTHHASAGWQSRSQRRSRSQPGPLGTTDEISRHAFDPTLIGKYWDEIEVGDHVCDSPVDSPQITEEMIHGFAVMTGDFNPIHVDRRFARRTVHRRPIAHGLLLASIVLGRYHNCGYTYGTTVALLHTDIEFVGRAYPGDRVRAEFIVTGKDPNPHPKRGVIRFHAWLRNATTNEPLVEIKFDAIVRRRRGAVAKKLEAPVASSFDADGQESGDTS